MDKSKSPSILSLFFTVAIIIVALIYGIIALNTQDSAWFISEFSEVPEAIDVYCYGTMTTLRPGDGDFNGLVEVINRTLSSSKNYDSLTMSDSTYDYYRTEDSVVVLEIIYTQKVRIHSIYTFFSNLDSIVIPLVGRHANTNAIFGRSNGLATGGALHYDSVPDVLNFVESSGICSPQGSN